jgi:hypothetical protein
MTTFKMRTGAGDYFAHVAERAKQLAEEKNLVVEFDFNGITCLVDKNSNLELLNRDYGNAHRMGWFTIGPDFQENYSSEVQAELDRKTKEFEEMQAQQERENEKKEKTKREVLHEKIKDETLHLLDPDVFEKGKSVNTDPYGGRVYSFAEDWAKLMQKELAAGKELKDIADQTSREADYDGITGFMYGAAVSVLVHTWKHGEALRKWHNKEYGHEGDGVVNPAVVNF